MADTVDPRGPLEGAETAHEDGEEMDGERVVEAHGRFQGAQARYRQVSDDVRRGAERARAEFQRGTERAREEFERGAERAREGYRNVAERTRDGYRNVAESARDGYDRVRKDAGRLGGEVSDFVRDNPARAVLIAAGVGFLLGMLVRRRDDDYEE